jgi:nucleolar protein 56
MEIVSTWFGVFVLDGKRIHRERRFPEDADALRERLRLRRTGALAPEERALLDGGDPQSLSARDRRFAALGARPPEGRPGPILLPSPSLERLRTLLLEEAEAALRDAWDPSAHIEEAVRAMSDIDRTENLLAERLASWTARDQPESEGEGTEPGTSFVSSPTASEPEAGSLGTGADPNLLGARAELARVHERLAELRNTLDRAVESAAQRSLPNLSSLLGPLLAARMVAQAGGLERLARLPASTIQVLGAEKAFFDHLRHGSRPPRHGLLFLHASIQGATQRQRGRLARALAGKAAIAARLDHGGRPLDAALDAS